MKVIIQIPCYNEAATLGTTVADLPRTLPGVNVVEWLVIDDGSTDGTAEVARSLGIDHVVQFPRNRGLAKAFMAGVSASLSHGADIIINTDADNQYRASDMPKLIEPIVARRADMVIGARPIGTTQHFSAVKKLLQRLGSWVVRVASRTDTIDAPSGFRAFSRRAAMQLNVFSEYTYTLETIIQAGQKGLTVESVPIGTNADLRPSRLVKSIPSYVRRSVLTIARIFMTYRPLTFFTIWASIPFTVGFALLVRWLVFFLAGSDRTRLPSLILAAILVVVAFQIYLFGLVADLMAVNRRLLEDIQTRVRQADFDRAEGSAVPPAGPARAKGSPHVAAS